MAVSQRAVIVYNSGESDRSQALPAYTTTDAVNHKMGKATPNELVLHETIGGLVSEVADLRSRCESLAEHNRHLDQKMQARGKNLAGAPVAPSSSLDKVNLIGYDSSDSSSESNCDDCSRLSTARSTAPPLAQQDIELQVMSKKIAVLAEVVNRSDARADACEKRQAAMATELQGLREYKAESSALFSALKAELERPSCDQHDASKEEAIATDSRVRALEGDLRIFQRAHKRFNDSYALRVETQDTIDNASTKEELYRLFSDLEKALWAEDSGGSYGIFRGSEKELMAFRSRILRGIALFEPVHDALQEARHADVDY